MSLTQITAPAVEPVTLAEVKDHCRVEHDLDDALIEGLITAARELVEQRTGRALITQQWQWSLDAFAAVLCPPRPPLQSVDSITYVDTDGTTQTLSPTEYRVDTATQPGRITEAYGKTWPAIRSVTGAVQITFTAGYGDYENTVPRALRQAMLLLIGGWYENREAVAPVQLMAIPFAVDALLSPHRLVAI